MKGKILEALWEGQNVQVELGSVEGAEVGEPGHGKKSRILPTTKKGERGQVDKFCELLEVPVENLDFEMLEVCEKDQVLSDLGGEDGEGNKVGEEEEGGEIDFV